jgi:hypothetical protein
MVSSQELESDNITLLGSNTLGGEGQFSALGNLDGDGLSVNAGRKTQKSGNDSGETHVSDKKRKKDFEKLVAAVRIEGFSEADKSSAAHRV